MGSKTAIFDICNPSDAMSIKADNTEVLTFLSVDVFASGKCAFDEVGGGRKVPIFGLFATDESIAAFFDETHGTTLEAFIAKWTTPERLLEAADCLDTLTYCDGGDRASLEAAFDVIGDADLKRKALAEFNDQRRSSMSDYASYAAAKAKRYREIAATKEAADAE